MRRLQSALLTASMRQGIVLVMATTLAYGLDYLFNLAAGRLLDPAEFGVVVSLAALAQVMVVASQVVKTVTARYVSRYQAEAEAWRKTAAFFRAAYGSAWRWGILVTALLLLLSGQIARFFRIAEAGPVLALAMATLLLAVRPVADGVLQGQQRFAVLGVVQVVQSVIRLAAGILLMALGWGAFGAMAALPLATTLALIFALYFLRAERRFSAESADVSFPDLLRYSIFAAAGLFGYVLLVNMDAILVKRFFVPETAGQYGAAVTLGKIIQFFPLAIIIILFPKAAQRQASQRSSTTILLAAMFVVGLFCGLISLLYFLFPDQIIRLVFGPAYRLEGPVLGLVGLAMLFMALANVWLNFFLSIEETSYVYLIWLGVGLQFGLIVLLRDTLWHIPAAVAGNGLWLALAGGLLYIVRRLQARSRKKEIPA